MIGVISYLSIALKKDKEYKIELISLEGNVHLSKERYLGFADLLDRSKYGNLTLQIIKDRIEKHPYVETADVCYNGNNSVAIKIKEKNFESILVQNNRQYLLTDKLQALPFLPKTAKIDYPVISEVEMYDSIKVLKSLKNNYDVLTASKILTGFRLLNPELFDELSMVDMRRGGDIVLSFSSFNYPVIVGRGNEIGKVVYFNSIWTYLKGKQLNDYMNYVDLRFSGHVFFGINKDSLHVESKKI